MTTGAAADQSGLAGLRNATAPFHDVDAARAAGYTVQIFDLAGITCIADPGGAGTMGIHFLNPSLFDDTVNATSPELVIYVPGDHGRLKLVAVEYLVLQADWDAVNTSPPSLFGEEFHLTPAGNRYGLPAFYELHAWVWHPNPSGMFHEWNPTVSC
ncbi:MAG TPA: hypothetical protein VGK63_04085 [Candidatus Limnocylindrales bacterium]